MARRDETAAGITQRDRARTDVLVSQAGQLVDPSGAPVLAGISQRLANGSLHIAHDGSGMCRAPSYYRASYRLGARLHPRVIVDGGNYRLLTDGTLVDAHDASLTSTINGQAWTASTGNVEDLDGIAAAQVVLKGSNYAGYGWPDQVGITTVEDILDAVAGTPFAPEPKTATAAAALAPLLAARGLRDVCLVNAFVDAWLTPFALLGFPHILRNLSGSEHATFDATRAAALRAAGITWVGVDRTHSSAVAAATVAVAAGLRVMVGIVTRKWHMRPFAHLPVSAWVSEDPLWTLEAVEVYRRTTTKWVSATPPIGLLAQTEQVIPPDRGTFTGGKIRFAPSTSTIRTALLGQLSPVANAAGTYTITVPFTIVARGATDVQWGPYVAICCPDDSPWDETSSHVNGYMVQVRNANGGSGGGSAGNIRIQARTNGTGGTLNTSPALSKELVASDACTLTITVTPTQISVALAGSATLATYTVNDATFRGGHIHIGASANAAGSQVDFGDITIT